jgi:hypothetical protein
MQGNHHTLTLYIDKQDVSWEDSKQLLKAITILQLKFLSLQKIQNYKCGISKYMPK